ncbi:hypothetical protein LOZ53_006185 [Ophidiomyces ophidiicola]|uniref:Uncharacterized protein n=1 Tax=Ophidiomyces ophidiicola TaxID=1387563 RepID=A0ACB8UM68_9EURO|nr:uncharacterized protein LOZ57_006858 [Ophidiomyces ophidiicola]KAI1905696.1 hypothetical protein LOZ64_006703 [Ophidiomyces ophidiicola]KAI1906241.1 hypothetical protein LOZ61_006774 [Ophidiomyces ophidiicola]KAI1919619.1 hypothetical protein LOZ60_006803 [Ophidiomyces ophidiicola]KAI1932312.1 hypothetical protein LOZ62_006683 [Ophidiomyces ophidiicola]KAI1935895.1 hypothetical protein LOZ57_006858 [Ophidiomyces ophidiicola]
MTNAQARRGEAVGSQALNLPPTRNITLLSRQDIESLIASGKHIVIFDGRVLKVDAWLQFHPGGEKAIKHMIGRDATDEINALHSHEARERMKLFQIGRIEGQWLNFLPPIQGGVFRCSKSEHLAPNEVADSQSSAQDSSYPPSPLFEAIDSDKSLRKRPSSTTSLSSATFTPPQPEYKDSKPLILDAQTRAEIAFDVAKYPPLDPEHQTYIAKKYRELNRRIQAEGLYDCNYLAYLVELSRYSILFGLFLFLLRYGWYGASGFFLGCMWHQLVFTAHDAGHMGITHHFHTDTVIGIIVADFIGGLSLGWWKRSHNVHHIVTNSPEHDPDIEHLPFFAVSHRFFSSLRSTYYDRIMKYDGAARYLTRYQNYLYYPVLLFGRFNLYRLSWEYLFFGGAPRKGPAWWHRWFEIVGQIFFWVWFGYGVVFLGIPDWRNRCLFVMVSHMVTAPLHVQITLSHFAMSTADLGVNESFAQKMLRTTMDVDCPPWLDFFHGGLQFQAIHHLYPRIPRHNLRRTQQLVKEFCKEVAIPYAIFTFFDGNKEVIGHLGDVANQARMLAECQKNVIQQNFFLPHHS